MKAKAKAKADWTANEVVDYAKHCILKQGLLALSMPPTIPEKLAPAIRCQLAVCIA
jgi:hypothetical protein